MNAGAPGTDAGVVGTQWVETTQVSEPKSRASSVKLRRGAWHAGCSFPCMAVGRLLLPLLTMCAFVGPFSATAHAEPEVAPTFAPVIPVQVTLESAARAVRDHGFDVLVAEAQVRGAQGDIRAQKALANPTITPFFGKSWGSGNCDGCPTIAAGAQLTEPSALSDLLSNKRNLRKRVAEHALEEARASKDDAVRNVVSDAKTQVVVLAGAEKTRLLLAEVAQSLGQTVDLALKRYPATIDEGQLARIQREKLTADGAVDRAQADIRKAQADLAFILGDRMTVMPTFVVSEDVLKFKMPAGLEGVAEETLARKALQLRPDLRAAGYEVARTDSAVDVANRSRVPDIGWNVNYQHVGAGQPSTVTFGVAIPLPIFNQRKGERQRAEADRGAAMISRDKVASRVVADVATSFGAFESWRKVVLRMDRELLERARKARDITELQYRAGSASLIDYLDAQRSYVQTITDYTAALVSYWSSVFDLEAAIGEELAS